ncbi:MAG: hypothetical protein COA67_11500 [Lutibacter sp.]|nr:MAG: hypothetical protein COA67_11500 [Lutibacter sp.]
MQFLKKLFRFYIFSNIHVAIGTFCLVKITLLTYGIPESNTALFVLFSTIVAYNFIRFYRISNIANWFSDWLKINKIVLYTLTLISVLIVVFLALSFQLKSFLWLLPFGVFTFFYGLPFPFKNIPLRNVARIKLFLIAISFAGITVLFPLVQNNIEINLNVWLIFIQRFLFIVLITIPFDIRDLYVDSESLKTLPQMVGIKKTKVIGVLLGVLIVLLEFLKQPIESNQLIIMLIVSIVSILFLINSKEKQSKYYCAFWVESLPIFWFLLIILRINM